MTDPIVHLYALVWNELPILPFFLEHYRPFVDRFFLFDDGSDDGSYEYLAAQPDVALKRFHSGGKSFVEAARKFPRAGRKCQIVSAATSALTFFCRHCGTGAISQ